MVALDEVVIVLPERPARRFHNHGGPGNQRLNEDLFTGRQTSPVPITSESI